MTDLQRHAQQCGKVDVYFVHVVACSRCDRIFDKYRGYELSKVDGDLCPSPNPAERVYRDEAGNVIQVGETKTDHIHKETPIALPKAAWWQRCRNKITLFWMRTFPSRQQREMIKAMRGAFQASPEIAEQYKRGRLSQDAGFDWYEGEGKK